MALGDLGLLVPLGPALSLSGLINVRQPKTIIATRLLGPLQSQFFGNFLVISMATIPVTQSPEASDSPQTTILADGSSHGDALVYLWAIPLLLQGFLLLIAGKVAGRITTGIGFGCVVLLAAWAALTGAESSQGFSNSLTRSNYIIFGVSIALSYVCVVLGATYLWMIGLSAIGVSSGLSVAFEIFLLGKDGLIHIPAVRWVIAGVLGIAGLISITFLPRLSLHVCSSLVGSFLFVLALDLMIESPNGWSLGLRYILDANKTHHAALGGYQPTTTTSALVGVAWGLAVIGSLTQLLLVPSKWQIFQLPSITMDGKWWQNEEEAETDVASLDRADDKEIGVVDEKGKRKEVLKIDLDDQGELRQLRPPVLPFLSAQDRRRRHGSHKSGTSSWRNSLISIPEGEHHQTSGVASTSTSAPQSGRASGEMLRTMMLEEEEGEEEYELQKGELEKKLAAIEAEEEKVQRGQDKGMEERKMKLSVESDESPSSTLDESQPSSSDKGDEKDNGLVAGISETSTIHVDTSNQQLSQSGNPSKS